MATARLRRGRFLLLAKVAAITLPVLLVVIAFSRFDPAVALIGVAAPAAIPVLLGLASVPLLAARLRVLAILGGVGVACSCGSSCGISLVVQGLGMSMAAPTPRDAVGIAIGSIVAVVIGGGVAALVAIFPLLDATRRERDAA